MMKLPNIIPDKTAVEAILGPCHVHSGNHRAARSPEPHAANHLHRDADEPRAVYLANHDKVSEIWRELRLPVNILSKFMTDRLSWAILPIILKCTDTKTRRL